MSQVPPDLQTFLPLSPTLFHILLALGDGELHGYGIMLSVLEHTQGRVRLGAGALYDSLKRLLANGLVAECDGQVRSGLEEERRRYYCLTPLGRRVAAAEVERLMELLQVARRKNMLLIKEQS